jgi:hypothetical protein
MGYHKQQEIADQLEVPERVPRPVSAVDHVALKRRNLRPRKQSTPIWVPLTFAGLFVFVAGIGVGVVL